MKRNLFSAFVTILWVVGAITQAQNPRVHWNFERIDNQKTIEAIGNKQDSLEGYFGQAPGVAGGGLTLDGFTACLRATGTRQPSGLKELTVESWIALGEYPWNWCPLLTTESDEVKGYRLMVGPLGQASFECAIGEQWISCTSGRDALPLRQWMHVVGVYRANAEMLLYINGEQVANIKINGAFTPTQSNMICGMVANPVNHRISTAPGVPLPSISVWMASSTRLKSSMLRCQQAR